jgi:biotin transport system substrate-specific component
MTTRDVALIGLFAAVTAVSAQASLVVPFMTGVPFTLQVFAVLASGAILGARRGCTSQLVYLLLGAAGAPVFARMHGGLGTLVGPTGGYLWSYPLAALVVGWSADTAVKEGADSRHLLRRLYPGMAAAIGVIYALGVLGLYASGAVPSLGRALRVGVLPFLWFDLLKAYIAGLVAVRVRAAVAVHEVSA